jgi:hypothetical protein
MFNENGFGNDRSHPSGLGEWENRRKEMNQENEYIAHELILPDRKTPNFAEN